MPVSYILYWTLGTVLKTRIFQKRFFVWELFVSVALQITAWVYRTLFLWGAQSTKVRHFPLYFVCAGRVLPPSSGALGSCVSATPVSPGFSVRDTPSPDSAHSAGREQEHGTRVAPQHHVPGVAIVLISFMKRAYQLDFFCPMMILSVTVSKIILSRKVCFTVHSFHSQCCPRASLWRLLWFYRASWASPRDPLQGALSTRSVCGRARKAGGQPVCLGQWVSPPGCSFVVFSVTPAYRFSAPKFKHPCCLAFGGRWGVQGSVWNDDGADPVFWSS